MARGAVRASDLPEPKLESRFSEEVNRFMDLLGYVHPQLTLSSGPYLNLVGLPETAIPIGFGSNDAVPVGHCIPFRLFVRVPPLDIG